MLGVVIKELRKEAKTNSLTKEINNRRLNSIYNITVAQATGQIVTDNEIENGMYDTMPE